MLRNEMSCMSSRHEMSDMRSRHEMSDMRGVTKWWDMSWVTWDELHVMKHVINWLWPYTFCEFPFVNPLVNPFINPFLIPWGQAEWCNDETWDEWETAWNPIPILLGRRTLLDEHMLLRRKWAEVTGNIMRYLVCRTHEQKFKMATHQYIGINLVSVT